MDEKTIINAVKTVEKYVSKSTSNRKVKTGLSSMYAMRGAVYLKKDDAKAAWKDMQQAIRLDDTNSLARQGIAVAAHSYAIDCGNANDLDEAVKIAKTGVEYDTSGRLNKLLAQLYLAKGDISEATKYDAQFVMEELKKLR